MKKSEPSFLFEAALDLGALLVIGSFLLSVSRANVVGFKMGGT